MYTTLSLLGVLFPTVLKLWVLSKIFTLLPHLYIVAVLVAEVTQVSLGVGYEIGRAVAMSKPILCLYRPQVDKSKSHIIPYSHILYHLSMLLNSWHGIQELQRVYWLHIFIRVRGIRKHTHNIHIALIICVMLLQCVLLLWKLFTVWVIEQHSLIELKEHCHRKLQYNNPSFRQCM